MVTEKKPLSTVQRLRDVIYQVRVKRIALMTVEELKQQGTYLSTDKQVDQAVLDQLVTVYLPIHRLATIYSQGHGVYVVQPQDVLAIYDAIQAHLMLWKEHLTYGVHHRNAPLEDLILLDNFAQSLYEYVKTKRKDTLGEGDYANEIRKFRELLKMNLPNPKFTAPSHQPPPRRESMADFFIGHYLDRRND